MSNFEPIAVSSPEIFFVGFNIDERRAKYCVNQLKSLQRVEKGILVSSDLNSIEIGAIFQKFAVRITSYLLNHKCILTGPSAYLLSDVKGKVHVLNNRARTAARQANQIDFEIKSLKLKALGNYSESVIVSDSLGQFKIKRVIDEVNLLLQFTRNIDISTSNTSGPYLSAEQMLELIKRLAVKHGSPENLKSKLHIVSKSLATSDATLNRAYETVDLTFTITGKKSNETEFDVFWNSMHAGTITYDGVVAV